MSRISLSAYPSAALPLHLKYFPYLIASFCFDFSLQHLKANEYDKNQIINYPMPLIIFTRIKAKTIKIIEMPNAASAPRLFIIIGPRNGAVAPRTPPNTVWTAIYRGVSFADAILVITTYPTSSAAANIKPAIPWAMPKNHRLYVIRYVSGNPLVIKKRSASKLDSECLSIKRPQ